MARKTGKAKKAGELISLFRELMTFLEEKGDKVFEITKEQFHKIKLRFHGKSFAIIGAGESGKTSFINVLRNPSFDVDPMLYSKTQEIEEFKTKIIQYNLPVTDGSELSSIKLKLRKPKDVGGEKTHRKEGGWAQVCEGADFVFYILDAYEFEKNDEMKNRFDEDVQWISENNQLYAPNFGIILFINKMDKISLDQKKRKEWADNNIPKIEAQLKNSLEAYHKHFLLAIPISLVSKVNRANAISTALLKVIER
ncbi:MAG: GTPase domain-containing protein [Candidatus Paceibacterota bacterium]